MEILRKLLNLLQILQYSPKSKLEKSYIRLFGDSRKKEGNHRKCVSPDLKFV